MSPKAKITSDRAPKRKKPHSQAAKFIFTVTKILIVFFIALSCSIAGILGGALVGYIKTTSPISDDKLKIQTLTSFFYDSNGKQISILTGSENKNRMIARYSEIPKNLSNAFVAIEDKRFYTHNGVDFNRTVGAVINMVFPTRGSFGGSTITMQVVRAITGDTRSSIQRKVQEQWRAIQLEKKLEKWQILELYENLIYIGENCYGVKSAAKTYFNKDLDQLTLAECASLAGITNLPVYYDPFTSEGRLHNEEREKIILKQMLNNGFIKQDEYDVAIKEKLKFVAHKQVTQQAPSRQSYFVDKVINDVINDLVVKGISKDAATTAVYNYGYKIYTTMDSKMQAAMDSVYKNKAYFPGGKNSVGESPQSSMVVVDPSTGQVRALYGGSGQKKVDRGINRATDSLVKRQAGSSFKPIAVYGPAIDTGTVTAATSVDDVPVYMNGTNNKRYPEDFPTGGVRLYHGLVSVRTAIAMSINVVAAKVYTKLGSSTAFEYLTKSGIDMSGENNSYLSVALGGLTNGVNPLKMAAAYVPFDNKGIYTQPITYTKVLDSDGNVILDKLHDADISPKSDVVYSEQTAFIMTDMLRSVVGSGGTASYVKLHNSKGQSIPIAAKTGTTNDDFDRWFVGFTPKFSAAVWYGYDHPSTISVYGNNPSAVIWNAVLQLYYDKSQAEEAFSMAPSGIVRKRVCKYSGIIATSLCTHDPRGNAAIYEYFLPGTAPKDTDLCDVHVAASVCTVSKDAFKRNLLAGDYCPASKVVEKVFIRRKVPYMPLHKGDPYPLDWNYSLPIEYCNIHGPSSVVEPTPKPVKTTAVPTEILVEDTPTPIPTPTIATTLQAQ